ncbi:MAG: Flp family type IVb pilin [Bosea sp.]|nr:Flp family type IVb pilin [Bosea sp. (in: a-proteobacteria)]
MTNLMNRFARDESGATAIEYGLIAALIAVACIASWRALGARLVDYFSSIAANMNT